MTQVYVLTFDHDDLVKIAGVTTDSEIATEWTSSAVVGCDFHIVEMIAGRDEVLNLVRTTRDKQRPHELRYGSR